MGYESPPSLQRRGFAVRIVSLTSRCLHDTYLVSTFMIHVTQHSTYLKKLRASVEIDRVGLFVAAAIGQFRMVVLQCCHQYPVQLQRHVQTNREQGGQTRRHTQDTRHKTNIITRKKRGERKSEEVPYKRNVGCRCQLLINIAGVRAPLDRRHRSHWCHCSQKCIAYGLEPHQ